MSLRQLPFFSLSFLIVALAQPDWTVLACLLASLLGYALFWMGMLQTKSRKGRFLQAVIWFSLIQFLQLSWFTADRYVGGAIYLFLAFILLLLGVQFGFISLFVRKNLPFIHMIGISGGWTLCEWIRLYLLSGYSWNPMGIALCGTLYGMQIVSVAGVFGLSFWIFFTNLLSLKLMTGISRKLLNRFGKMAFPGDHGVAKAVVGSKLSVITWGLVAFFPYLFGYAHIAYHEKRMKSHPDFLSVLLVQTSIYPESKLPFQGSTPLPPHTQWERILKLLLPQTSFRPHLIVLPEAVVPYGADLPIYPLELVKQILGNYVGSQSFHPEATESYVGNLFWTQALANLFSADVLIGLEDYERNEEGKVLQAYNAAFLVRPGEKNNQRYEKRVLVPMGEYIPFKWCRKFLAKYGIVDSFTPGKETKVFQTSRLPAGVSICYEETYGHIMRESRQKGASLLVNLTNDVWYPRSRLPIVHFFHGRLRAVETGVPLLRSCNTGVTCGVDSLGRITEKLPYESRKDICPAGVLPLSLSLYNYKTIYTRFGDLPIVCFSSVAFISFWLLGLIKRKSFSLNDLTISPLRKN